jgi:hypothetical protein
VGKNFAGDAALTKGSIDHLHELFPDARFYTLPDRAQRRQGVEFFYPPVIWAHQSARDLFEYGPGYLWQALWASEDNPSALWNVYAEYGNGAVWGPTERFDDVVADLETRLWLNVRADFQVDAADLGRAIVLYRLQWEARCGSFETAIAIHS